MGNDVKPFLKWAGGKRQLLDQINKFRVEMHGEKYSRYYEPFAGGAAYFFNLKPKMATLNDINEEIINAYKAIRNNCEQLICELKKHEDMDLDLGSKYYYEIRNWDREPNYKIEHSEIARAARIIYLNKKCYNGLYRVNSNGFFNVPYDAYKKPFKPDNDNLRAISHYLNENDIRITNDDYETAVSSADENDLIYFDPPYYPATETANFDNYTANGFGKDIAGKQEEQIRLKRVADKLSEKGCIVIISNSNTEFIESLYSNKIESAKSDIQYYIIHPVTARRMINSIHSKRVSDKHNELLITNRR